MKSTKKYCYEDITVTCSASIEVQIIEIETYIKSKYEVSNPPNIDECYAELGFRLNLEENK